MWSNTKLLVLTSLSILLAGFGLIWFGLKNTSPKTESFPAPTVANEPLATSSAALGEASEQTLVTKVVDGDTIIINNTLTVRLIGIDTPETVDPRRPIGCFGKEASNETKRLLLSKNVILEKDISDTDKYDRLLRYVYLPLENGQLLFVNDYLIREGFAKAYAYPPDVKFSNKFIEAEKGARDLGKGLWGRCN